ncbi:MAG: lysophospholipid acyltransferase family protein, partial [Chloroflexi bacterium]|nr:lysophospholipid acyltransferase family protein [Chloroflexota bacterium]
LRRNESVAFLVDKPIPGDSGVEVDFFGNRTRIPAGAAFFASRSGAPMVPAFVWRKPDRSFAVRVFPPIRVPRGGDLAAAMQEAVHCLEAVIRTQPQDWYMFRSMWPTRRREAVA